jgi:hypothetical protein
MQPQAQEKDRHPIDVIGVVVRGDDGIKGTEIDPHRLELMQRAAPAINQDRACLSLEDQVGIVTTSIRQRCARTKHD